MSRKPKKLLDRVRDVLRLKRYSIRTEEAYVDWIKRYVLFHDKRHPFEMDVAEIEAFLTHKCLAKTWHVLSTLRAPGDHDAYPPS